MKDDEHVQERAEQTRRSLLEAAASLFDERGYAGTSISDITARSGHTSGAIYFHYTSKERLALAVVQEHFATWPPLINRHTGLQVSALEQLVRLSFAVARAFRDDIVVRAGARLWTERSLIAAPFPPPFIGWIDAIGAMLENGPTARASWPPCRSAAAARTIVCASSAFTRCPRPSTAGDSSRTIWPNLDPAAALAAGRARTPRPPRRPAGGGRVPDRGPGYFQISATHSGWSMNGLRLCWQVS